MASVRVGSSSTAPSVWSDNGSDAVAVLRLPGVLAVGADSSVPSGHRQMAGPAFNTQNGQALNVVILY